MKIKLETPFKEKYEYGYLVTNKEPRRHVILYNSKDDRTSLSFARYLMSVHLKRELNKDEVVDHVDGNQLHDLIENLQILTYSENILKGCIENNKSELLNYYRCGCGKEFSKAPRNIYTDFPCCSRSCATKQQYDSQPKTIFLEQKRKFEGIQKQTYDEEKVLQFIKSISLIKEDPIQNKINSLNFEELYNEFLNGSNLTDLSQKTGLSKYILSGEFNNRGFKLTVQPTKIDWPSREELIELIKNNSIRQVGIKLGVSDNTVRKRCRKLHIDYKNLK